MFKKNKAKKKTHEGAPQLGLSQSNSLSWKIHKNGCGLFFWESILIIKCYKGHLEQPHSRAVSISSEYELPSVQRKNTFLLLLLVAPQQRPVAAAAWQDRGQSMRGILLVDVHVLSGWCRFSCSLTISPWHETSGQEIRQMLMMILMKYFNSDLHFQQASFYLCHRRSRCILADSDRRACHSLKDDTLHSRSAAPCRLEAPAVDHSTDPGSLRCTCNCRSLRLGDTDHENIWSEEGQS